MCGGIGLKGIVDQDIPLSLHAFDSEFVRDLPEPLRLGSGQSGADHDRIAGVGVRPDESWEPFPKFVAAFNVHAAKV